MNTFEKLTRSGVLFATLLAAAALLGGPKGCDDDPAEDEGEGAVEAPPAEEPTPAPSEEREKGKGDTDVTADDGAGKPTGDGGEMETAPEVVGTWSSASCGPRTYAREMVLLDGGTYVRVDLVSPCPPGAKCVWSGILSYRGSWAFDGTAIALSGEEQVGATGGGDTFGPGPRKLVYQADPLMLVEPLASARCEYLPADPRDVTSYLKMSAVE
jgi:hypothetical protein